MMRIVCLFVVLSACTRQPPSESTEPPVTLKIDDSNPFLRSYEGQGTVITYERNDHTRRTIWSTKSLQSRRVDEGGAFDTPGDYSTRTPDYEYNVVAGRSQVIEITSAERILFGLFKALDPKAKAAVLKSVNLIGSDLPFYSEHEATFLRRENILGLDAACYRFYQSMLDDTSERCYWRGLEVSFTGKNPISGEDMSGRITHVDRNVPLDDATFTWPTSFTVQHHDPKMDEIMTGIYADLIERMQRPDFTLAQLSRYAR